MSHTTGVLFVCSNGTFVVSLSHIQFSHFDVEGPCCVFAKLTLKIKRHNLFLLFSDFITWKSKNIASGIICCLLPDF